MSVESGAGAVLSRAGQTHNIPDDEAARPLSHGFGGDGVAIFYERWSSVD